MKTEKKRMSPAMLFIILFGIVSLFSDMTHEGASSIRGAYLALLGAGAGRSALFRDWGNSSVTPCAVSSAGLRTEQSSTGR